MIILYITLKYFFNFINHLGNPNLNLLLQKGGPYTKSPKQTAFEKRGKQQIMKKRLTALLLALSMVLTCIGFSPTAAFAAEENIALNKPATTSRADYNNPEITPSMAVDGTTSTRWASGPYYPQQHGPTDENWICIDLGAVYDISRVVLNWEAAYSPDYDIQVSNDYTTFTTIYNGSASGASVQNERHELGY